MHCHLKDQIACARETVEFSEQRFGADDPRTKAAREQLEEEMRAKDASEQSAPAVPARSGVRSKLRRKPN